MPNQTDYAKNDSNLLDSLLEALVLLGIGLEEKDRSHAERSEIATCMDTIIEAYNNEIGDN